MSLRTGLGLVVFSLVLVFGFQNCTQAKFSEVESLGKLSSELPAVDDAVIDEPAEVVDSDEVAEETDDLESGDRVECATRQNSAVSAVQVAEDAEDLEVTDERGNKKYLDFKSIILNAVRGNIQARADTIKIAKSDGNVRVKANSVSEVSESGGNICLTALQVGKVSKVNGNLRIAAQEIEEISEFKGNLRIYGGTVKLLSNIKSGNICLHGGAKVLAVSNVAVRIINCD